MGTNGTGTQFSYGFEKQPWILRAPLQFGATGAVTLEKWNPSNANGAGSYSAAPTSSSTTGSGFSPTGSRGIASVVKNATGDYTITLQGSYQRILGMHATAMNSASTGTAAPNCSLVFGGSYAGTDVTTAGGGTVEVLFTTTTTASVTPAGTIGTATVTAAALNAALTAGSLPFASNVTVPGEMFTGTATTAAAATQVATNPGNGEFWIITIELDNSSV